jgi:molybdenum cofactor biosynthesis enzyme MoaA
MFCTRPFTHAYLDDIGDLHLCCPGWMSRTAGNILETNALDLWKGKKAREIRDSVSDGSFRYCVRCQYLPGPQECVVDEIPRNLSSGKIASLSLNHDPICNLSCRSCRLVSRKSEPVHASVHAALLESGLLGSVERICASGNGDPVASRIIWPMLCHLSELGAQPSLTVGLQTNGLLLTPEKWGELGDEQLRIDRLSVSIDGATEETYARNRGGDWWQLMRNLGWMGRLGRHLQLNFVVQHNNFREMESFVELARSVEASSVLFTSLINFGTYSNEDYRSRAVHLPGHPNNAELLKTINQVCRKDDVPFVSMIGFPERK